LTLRVVMTGVDESHQMQKASMVVRTGEFARQA
jgi:hypothetical protein